MGRLSYCKVRALTRIATPENQDLLVKLGETGTVSHVEKTVRLYRRTDRAKELSAANDLRAERGLRCFFDESGALVIQGRLDPEQGALVVKALQAAGDALRQAERDSREASEEQPDRAKQPYPARMADALGLACETFLAKGAAPLAAGERGSVLDIGRKSRAIPPALRRALEARDQGCRFSRVHQHAVRGWAPHPALGGRGRDQARQSRDVVPAASSLRSRVRLPDRSRGDELRFVRPDGRLVPAVPASQGIDAAKGVVALTAAHESQKIPIGARTAVPKWFGERMDYG